MREKTMDQLQKYVGRIVSLNKRAYQAITEKARRQGVALENSFIVAAVSRRMRTLVCYGHNFRITVRAADVVLV
jgi:hypothetical protein